jgi:hypothetical protein
MDTYAYLNAVLDAKPEIVALNLNATVYPIAIGPVPDGEPDLKTRAALSEMPAGSVPDLCEGVNAAGDVIANFFC